MFKKSRVNLMQIVFKDGLWIRLIFYMHICENIPIQSDNDGVSIIGFFFGLSSCIKKCHVEMQVFCKFPVGSSESVG